MYKLKQQLKDILNYSYTTFENEISKGFIVYIDSNGVLNVYDVNKQELLFVKKLDNNYGISFIDDLFFLRKKENNLFKLDIVSESLEPFYKCSDKENFSCSVGVLSKDLVIETQSKVVDFNIIEKYSKIINPKTSEIIYSWKGLEYLIQKEGSIIYIKPIRGNNLIRKNITSGKIEYNINFDDDSLESQILEQTKEDFYIKTSGNNPNQSNLYSVNKNTGEINWKTETSLLDYSLDNNKLYGLGGKRFEVISTLTGKKELVAELDINIVISSHLTYYNDGFLYFSSHLDNNIPVFGAVNVKTGKLDFIQEVKIEGEKSFRIGLEKPIVVDNRLYVKDSLNNLHIFEKDQNETT